MRQPLLITVHDLHDALETLREARDRKRRHAETLRKRGRAKILGITLRRAEADADHLARVIERFEASVHTIDTLTEFD